MNKAEDRALEAYPPKMRYVGIDSVKNDRKIDVNKPMRDRYVKAYHQAEKDLELTWEDLKLLQDISHEVFAEVANGSVDYYQIYPTQQSFLEEVLKRFKERKEV